MEGLAAHAQRARRNFDIGFETLARRSVPRSAVGTSLGEEVRAALLITNEPLPAVDQAGIFNTRLVRPSLCGFATTRRGLMPGIRRSDDRRVVPSDGGRSVTFDHRPAIQCRGFAARVNEIAILASPVFHPLVLIAWQLDGWRPPPAFPVDSLESKGEHAGLPWSCSMSDAVAGSSPIGGTSDRT